MKVFLIGKGVEIDLIDTENFKVSEHSESFIKNGGRIFVCGTCLEIHQLEAPEIYKVSTLKDIYEIIKESDRVITF